MDKFLLDQILLKREIGNLKISHKKIIKMPQKEAKGWKEMVRVLHIVQCPFNWTPGKDIEDGAKAMS